MGIFENKTDPGGKQLHNNKTRIETQNVKDCIDNIYNSGIIKIDYIKSKYWEGTAHEKSGIS